MKKIHHLKKTVLTLLSFLCLLPWLLTGCGFDNVNSIKSREKMQEEKEKAKWDDLTTDDGPQDALRLVQKNTVAESNLSTEEWIRKQLSEEDGQIMFPKWEARRKNMQEYEVKFTYTKLNDDYTIEKKGYSWFVNYVLRLVSNARTLSEKDFKEQPGHKSILQRPARSTKRTIDLE